MANGWHRLLRRAQRYQELPLAALQAIAELRPQLAELEQAAVQAARKKGATWQEDRHGHGDHPSGGTTEVPGQQLKTTLISLTTAER